MKKTKIVQELLKAIEQKKYDQAESYLSEDFVLNGPMPNPASKKEWLDLHKKLSKGIPDFSFNLKKLNESGNTVNASVQVGGTHTNEIPSIMPGVESIPPTNKKVLNAEENVTITFKGDKISSMTVERVPNGGVAGLLKQLGVVVPSKA
jgi:predicted ester cyclase